MAVAPSTPGIYEYRAISDSWVPLIAYEVVQGALGGVLTPSYGFVAPEAPTAPYGLRLVSKSSTTINIAWSEDADATVGTRRVYLNGVKRGADRTGSTLTASLTGLTPLTTYLVTVTRVNSLGVESGPSNTLSVTTDQAVVGLPAAPTTMNLTARGDTSASFSWSSPADPTVTKQWRYLDGAKFSTSIGAAATATNVTGLTPGTSHTFYVTRENSAGESGPSPERSFTTTGGNTSVQHDVVMGVPDNDEAPALLVTDWKAARVYTFGGAQDVVNKWGCRVIGLTDNATSLQGGAASATRLANFLEGFYYTSAGVPKNTGVEIHWANGNEVDKDGIYTSGNLPAAYIDTYRRFYDVVRTRNADGSRRYPMASMWVDLTQHQIKINASGPRFKAIAPYLDGMACSMYPPGRDLSKNRPDSPIFTPFAQFADNVFAVMDDWHTSYPQCNQFATWEIGIPIDHASWAAGGTKDSNGAATANTNYTIRPRYFTGGVDSAGFNHKGFLQYTYDALDAIGVAMREQLYWNQCVNPDIPNQFKWDRTTATVTRANPDTERAWRNWVPGRRLANG